MTANGTASGKVILLGEHAVVYGIPAIAAGIDRGARAEAHRTASPSRLKIGGREALADETSGDNLERAFAALLAKLHGCVEVTAETDLPMGGGLGSSAALGVAIAKASLTALGEPCDAESVSARAMAWERVHHGNPSGIDTAAALQGGILRYVRGEGVTPLRCNEGLTLAVGWSGQGASTKRMVESVATLVSADSLRFSAQINEISAIVEASGHALKTSDLAALGALFDRNHAILASWALSTPALESLCAIARRTGAHGAKLTGAGGGGSAIALVDDDGAAERVLAAWREAGYSGFAAHIAASGDAS